MDFRKTFDKILSNVYPYSSYRVVFVDKFGIRWGIMTEQTEQ